MNDPVDMALLFALVFALNVVPAFAPPTWMALSWISIGHPPASPFVVAVIAALAATTGRLVLAKLSRAIIRNRFMSESMRSNIDVIKHRIERHRALTSGAFLLYAFGPLPSNYLFIAYGLTPLPLYMVGIPFFLGRTASYTFFIYASAEVARRFSLAGGDARPWFSTWFVVSQVVLLIAVIALARIDWEYLFAARRLRWLRREPPTTPPPAP